MTSWQRPSPGPRGPNPSTILVCPLPNDVLKSITPKRRKDAEVLLAKKRRENEDVGLLECFQLCDLRDIFTKSVSSGTRLIGDALPTLEKSQFRERLRQFEDYRNSIAHAQQLTVHELRALFGELRDMIEAMEARLRLKELTDEDSDDTEQLYPATVEDGPTHGS